MRRERFNERGCFRGVYYDRGFTTTYIGERRGTIYYYGNGRESGGITRGRYTIYCGATAFFVIGVFLLFMSFNYEMP